MREAIESNQGYVFQVIGDAFCAAFHTAGEAICAAIKTQMDLKAVNWECTPIKVRIGIHTGKAEFQKADGLYAGHITMSRVQRLMSAGCGGQVLVSFATQELVHHDLPTDVELDDLGKWHLKNLSHPEHIYQLKIPGLPCEFPSLRKNLLKDSSMDTIRLLIADDHALF